MKLSKEIRTSIDAVIDYNFNSEQKDYEMSFDVEITNENINDPDTLEHQEHIFYHLLVVQQFLNQ